MDLQRWIKRMAGAVLMGLVMAACGTNGSASVTATPVDANEWRLQPGERFTLVCAYKGAVLVYGDNSDEGNPPTGIVGVCQ